MEHVEKELSDILTYVAELDALELDGVDLWLMHVPLQMYLERMKQNHPRS